MLLNSEPVSIDVGLLVFRVSAGGAMFFEHGWSKLQRLIEGMGSDEPLKFADPFGLGPAFSLVLVVLAETVCSALVVLGLWTRISTIPLIIAMAVAAFITNGGQPFGEMELAVCYLTAFVAIFFAGSGRFSLDRLKFQ